MPATVKKLADLTTTPGNIAGDVSNVLFKMYDSVARF